MNKDIKKAIPKSHYEIALDYISLSLGNFNDFVKKIESLCGSSPTFYEFSKCLHDFKISSLQDESEEQRTLQANIMFHMFNMSQCNKPIYYVTPQLAINLAKTALNVDTEFVLSPFPEIYVQIDPGLFKLSDSSGEYPVKGFYVYFLRYDTGDIELRIMATAIIKTDKGFLDDTNFYFKLILKPGKLKESLKEYLSTIMSLDNKDDLIRFGGISNVDHVEEFTNFVINVLLYLTSKNPDIIKQLPFNFKKEEAKIKSPKKLRRLQKKKEKLSSCPVIIVGPNIPVDISEYSEIKKNGGICKWKLKHKVKVSAHWRIQWYGSAKDNSRYYERIRIESYVKGPDTAETLHRKRIVK